MELGSQLTLYPVPGKGGMDSPRNLSVDFASTERDASAWLPQGATARVALSNVTDAAITVTERDSNEEARTFTLTPHQTIVNVRLAGPVAADAAPFITNITYSGPVDAVRAYGFVEPRDGDAYPLRFYDPAESTTTTLTAVGLKTSDPVHVAVFNTSVEEQTVKPEVVAAGTRDAQKLAGAPLSIPAHGAAYIDVGSLLKNLQDQDVSHASLRLRSNAPKGTLIGSATEEVLDADALEDVPFRTSNLPRFMRGAYPLRWNKDYRNTPMVSNSGENVESIQAYVLAGGRSSRFRHSILQSRVRLGSAIVGNGVQVQSQTLTRYTDHATSQT